MAINEEEWKKQGKKGLDFLSALQDPFIGWNMASRAFGGGDFLGGWNQKGPGVGRQMAEEKAFDQWAFGQANTAAQRAQEAMAALPKPGSNSLNIQRATNLGAGADVMAGLSPESFKPIQQTGQALYGAPNPSAANAAPPTMSFQQALQSLNKMQAPATTQKPPAAPAAPAAPNAVSSLIAAQRRP